MFIAHESGYLSQNAEDISIGAAIKKLEDLECRLKVFMGELSESRHTLQKSWASTRAYGLPDPTDKPIVGE